MYVLARKRQFVLNRELCASAEDYLMYFHTRKHHFVHHSSPCACVEGCVVYVPAWKCQFVHFQRPGASTVDRVRYLYTRKRFAMIRVHAQEALQGISLLGIASL